MASVQKHICHFSQKFKIFYKNNITIYMAKYIYYKFIFLSQSNDTPTLMYY
jgi:hypothetical protein